MNEERCGFSVEIGQGDIVCFWKEDDHDDFQFLATVHLPFGTTCAKRSNRTRNIKSFYLVSVLDMVLQGDERFQVIFSNA